jgi:molybdate transport system substrate-binding protein
VLAPSGALTKRVQDGETPDAIVTTSTGIDALAKSGKVDGATARALASSGVGLAVRKGAPRPDISSAEALRATLLAAKSVAYSDPAGGGASGIHFAKVLGQLGIAAQVNARAKLGRGIPNAEFLVKGESDIAVQQVPELMVVPGVDILGQLPGSLNNITVFSVAALRSSGNAAAARALVEFLAAPEALALMRAKGFSPAP